MKTLNKFVIQLAKPDDTSKKAIFSKFDKKELTKVFIKFCRISKDGDEIEYWKQNKKWFYTPMLTVENKKGKLRRLVVKGEKCYYYSFDPQKLLNDLKG